MSATGTKPLRWSALLSGMLAACLFYAAPVHAQDGDQGGNSDPGYRTGENTTAPADGNFNPSAEAPAPDAAPADTKTQGPVRMARFAYVRGNVRWRTDANAEWSPATVNMPIRQGSQVWVNDGGRANVQFDDGSELRLGNDAIATLKLLYSDTQGEFTQVTLKDGLATLRSRHDDSVYQIDTPIVSVKTKGSAQIRLGVDNGAEVAVQSGTATIEGPQGKITLGDNNYLYLADSNAPYEARPLPPSDSWDRWNTDRNRQIDDKSETTSHVPPNIGLVAGDLDDYGTWREDPHYGYVWCPRVTESDWRPYYHGHWVWADPFGWTWVADEPWGWAPYHYGTWVEEPYGWAWCPGPAAQYWSPAVVHFSLYAGNVAWAPLCPWEVHYPAAFSLGVFGNNWAFSFSIGCAGVYYPVGDRFCEGRRFDNFYVNRFDYGHHDFDHHDFFRDHHEFASDHHFVPYNASHGAGATFASTEAFGGRGSYRAAPRADTSFFTRGQSFTSPAGRNPVSGPLSIQPTRQSMTATRSFESGIHPPQAVLARGVYHGVVPASVQRNLPGPGFGRNSSTSFGERSHTGTAASGNSGIGSAGHTPFNGGSSRYTGGGDRSAAEAARQARESLGMNGRGQGSGYSGSSGRTGGERYNGSSERYGSSSDRYNGSSERYGSSSDRYNGSSGRNGGSNTPNYGSERSGGSSYSGRYNGSSGHSSWGGNSGSSSGRGSYGGGSSSWRNGETYRSYGGGHSYSGGERSGSNSSGGGRSDGGGRSGSYNGGGGGRSGGGYNGGGGGRSGR